MAQDAFGPDGLLKPSYHGTDGGRTSLEYMHHVIPKTQIRFLGNSGISDYAADYAFFTPAILYLRGGFTDGPLADFIAEVRRDVPFFFAKFSAPLFRGLESPDGNSAWNHGLFAVRRSDWDELSSWLLTLVLMNPVDRQCNAVAEQRLTVPDRGGAAEVVAFALRGSAATWAFVQDGTLPRLARLRPSAGTAAFADALLLGENPVDAAKRVRTEWIETSNGGSHGKRQ